MEAIETYSSVLDTFCLPALQGKTMALVLDALRSNETLDLGSFGVRFLALALGLDFTTDDEFADLDSVPSQRSHRKFRG